jgi:hypothetical protein
LFVDPVEDLLVFDEVAIADLEDSTSDWIGHSQIAFSGLAEAASKRWRRLDGH